MPFSPPFSELHLHLEGALEPDTLCKIDPSLTPDEVRERYRFSTFQGFLDSYKWVVGRLNRPEDYALAARRLRLEEHTEVNLSVGVMLKRGLDARAIVNAVRSELPGCPLIFDAVRQFGGEAAIAVAELAAEYGAGFGVGGDETALPLARFREAIRLSPRHFYPHAGETSNAQNVWEAVDLGAARIGHGIRAIEDPALCRELRERKIPLEISLSSNVATGAVGSLAAHPLRRLFDLGVPVTLNTDDPAMFATTLAREYDLARRTFGFGDREMETIRQNAFEYRRTDWSRRASAGE
jgi:adenosine deaminase/aminodeoxyfutalosine deaminase